MYRQDHGWKGMITFWWHHDGGQENLSSGSVTLEDFSDSPQLRPWHQTKCHLETFQQVWTKTQESGPSFSCNSDAWCVQLLMCADDCYGFLLMSWQSNASLEDTLSVIVTQCDISCSCDVAPEVDVDPCLVYHCIFSSRLDKPYCYVQYYLPCLWYEPSLGKTISSGWHMVHIEHVADPWPLGQQLLWER